MFRVEGKGLADGTWAVCGVAGEERQEIAHEEVHLRESAVEDGWKAGGMGQC